MSEIMQYFNQDGGRPPSWIFSTLEF